MTAQRRQDDTLREAVERVMAFHQPTSGMGYNPDNDDDYGEMSQVCSTCGTSGEYGVKWPCATYRELEAALSEKPPCRHEESLYGRCTRCGMTWEAQATERAHPAPDAETERCKGCSTGATDVDVSPLYDDEDAPPSVPAGSDTAATSIRRGIEQADEAVEDDALLGSDTADEPWRCSHNFAFGEHYCDEQLHYRWKLIGAEQVAHRDAPVPSLETAGETHECPLCYMTDGGEWRCAAHDAPVPSPAPEDEREADCDCGHPIWWHHETKGCLSNAHGDRLCWCRVQPEALQVARDAALRARVAGGIAETCERKAAELNRRGMSDPHAQWVYNTYVDAASIARSAAEGA